MTISKVKFGEEMENRLNAEKFVWKRKLLHLYFNSHCYYYYYYHYSGRKITASFSYVIQRGEGKIERAEGSKTAKSLNTYSVTENIFSPFNFDTIGGILIH
jgi:hypothetical protein